MSNTNLIIVESPSKIKTLQNFLDNNYQIEASVGHIRDLPKSDLGIDLENSFTPTYIVSDKSKKVVKNLKQVLKNVDTSVLNGWHFISFVPLAILSIYFEGNPMDYLYPIENSVIFVVLHQALVVSLIGHVGMFYLYKFYSVATVLPFYSLFPIFGIILTFIIFY